MVTKSVFHWSLLVPHQLAKAVFVRTNVSPSDWETSKIAKAERSLQEYIGELKLCCRGADEKRADL